MTHYPRPQEPTVSLDRLPVEGSCAHCGANQLRRYPVMSEGGWFMVVKCQDCLSSASREPWRRLGPVELLSDLV